MVRGQRPVPPPAVCRELLEQVGSALLAVRRSARVTLSAVGTGVAVSVVVDCTDGAGPGPEPPGRPDSGEITTVTVADEQWTWVEARWTPSPSR